MNSEVNKTLGGLKEKDLAELVTILEQQPAVEDAILFGSRAKGNYKNGSDVDIALKGEFLHFKTINHISYLLNEETQLPYKFDILNYNAADKEVVAHVDRVGITFFSR